MKKYKLDFIEFYITNACNLGCNNCRSLSNYFFAGAWKWKDYSDVYAKWSEILEFNRITILGGEPFLNPSLIEYVQGINQLWPDTTIEIATNGSYFTKKDYYDIFKTCNVTLDINAHSRERYNMLEKDIYLYLKGNIEKKYIKSRNTEVEWVNLYNNVIRGEHWPTVKSFNDWKCLPDFIKQECTIVHKISPDQYLENTTTREFIDENGIKIKLNYAESFVLSPLKYTGNNKFNVYDNDPELAHNTCISKYCHHFIAGKIYKCHHVGLLPQFLKQFHVEMSDEDLQLLDSYVPATVDMNKRDLDNFFNNIKNTIPQCKFCPVHQQMTFPIESVNSKLKIEKIIAK
jgi:organic radical activating enzyme